MLLAPPCLCNEIPVHLSILLSLHHNGIKTLYDVIRCFRKSLYHSEKLAYPDKILRPFWPVIASAIPGGKRRIKQARLRNHHFHVY